MPLTYQNQTNYGAKNPFFDNGNLYGADHDSSNAYYVNGPTGYLESDPQAIWTRWTSPFAGGDDAFSRFVQAKQKDVWNGYDAAAATNPNLLRQDYVKGFGADFFRHQFNNLSESQRGINSALSRGRARWTSNG